MLIGLIEHQPDIYLDELQDALVVEQHGVVIGTNIIWNVLKELGLT